MTFQTSNDYLICRSTWHKNGSYHYEEGMEDYLMDMYNKMKNYLIMGTMIVTPIISEIITIIDHYLKKNVPIKRVRQ